MAPGLLPASFTLAFDPGLRRPSPTVLIGGAPVTVLRLTPAGAQTVDGWMSGLPVGPGRAAGALAGRLVDTGLAHPRPPAGPPPTVVVVIPVRDDPAGLRATLDALRGQDAPVLVVDDGSKVAVTSRWPARSPVRVLRQPLARGPAAARNRGWHAAREAEVIVFLDAGCVPRPGWLATVLGHFADPCVAAVAPRVTSVASPVTPTSLALYDRLRSSLDLGPRPAPIRPGGAVPYVPSAALAVRRQALEEVSGFDETMRVGEDVDLVWRLVDAGWRLRYEPGARVGHPARVSWSRWLGQRFEYGRSAAPLAARHGRYVAPLAVSRWSLAAWVLTAAGWVGPGLVTAAASAAVLARRAGGDRTVVVELLRLAGIGHARAIRPLARVIRRAWLPPALVVGAWMWPRGGRARSTALGVGVAVLPGLADWASRQPAMGPLRWSAIDLADDLAYQAGMWAGVLRTRSGAALLPRWLPVSGPPGQERRGGVFPRGQVPLPRGASPRPTATRSAARPV